MKTMNTLIERDLKHIWHPCSQMKEFETTPPLVVNRAQGSWLYTPEGPIIDAISSWWCKSLGHGHPKVIQAIQQQLSQFEHIITANTTFPALASLGEKLAEISLKQHVFFASDGASAVEIAMKIALQAQGIQGHAKRRDFIALKNSYHGETLATLSISDLGIYKKPYEGFGVQCHFLDNIPYVLNPNDPLWHNCEAVWPQIESQLAPLKDRCAALIIEPMVQGAGGMLCYSADFLARLTRWAKAHGIYCIADEIMTGIGRTGKWLACQHAGVEPDLICLSKGLTSGTLPLSCVLIDNTLFELFYDDYASGKSFLHSHTYSGNALAVAAALATLEAIESEDILRKATQLGNAMHNAMQHIANISQKLTRVRAFGAIVAADFVEKLNRHTLKRFEQIALQNGALLRPIGNTVYWLPPLNTDESTLSQLAEITLQSINAL
jgi:adenosylmethionine-8-amino-7-oxononanoate aminotransferase